jgi:hypothetical protein
MKQKIILKDPQEEIMNMLQSISGGPKINGSSKKKHNGKPNDTKPK